LLESAKWEFEDEACPGMAIRPALHPHPATMEAYVLLNEAQAESGATVIPTLPAGRTT
tara:strand:- start:229 stop:402 length:174 start_codon:yes stop_codon:yes gene_type:complete